VDENLFYKGVDKRAVHGARLYPSLVSAEPGEYPSQQSLMESTTEHPSYPFESGDSLLALTKKHNVRQKNKKKKTPPFCSAEKTFFVC
jgi:hypothetical protein